MEPVAAAILFAVLILDTVSHLALKGASEAASQKTGFAYWGRLLKSFGFWLGIVCFFALFVCWLAFLSLVPLAQGVMAGSITIVGVMLGGRLLYGERITAMRALAIGLIAVGVALVGWGNV